MDLRSYGSITESSAAIPFSLETNSPANLSLLARAELVLALSTATTRPARLNTGTETLIIAVGRRARMTRPTGA